MKALLSLAPGGPDSLVLGELLLPTRPADGQVRIDVRACAVNFPDVLIIADRYQVRPPRPFAPGVDVSGVVQAVGTGVTGFSPGDRVMAQCRWGGMAEQVDVRQEACAPIHSSMPFDIAAAMLTAHGTAMYALRDCADLQRDETVLVLGASGGVGLAAVEVARAMGARVVAAVSSEQKLAVAMQNGAATGVVYPTTPVDKASLKPLVEQFRSACGSMGPNVVLDVVGGSYSEAALRALATDGRFLVVGFAAGIPSLPMNLVLLKRAHIIGVAWSRDLDVDPAWLRRQLDELVQMHAHGRLHPLISERYPLARGAEAIARLADRGAVGKIIVEV